MSKSAWYRHGGTAWTLAAAGVLTWDAVAADGEMMTDRFRDGLRKHPVSAAAITAAWGTLTLHLFGALPERLDPFHHLLQVRRLTRRAP